MILNKVFTFEDAKAHLATIPEKHRDNMQTVWWSFKTAWWTHDPNDLRKGPVPLDPFGSPLFQGNLEQFLAGPEGKPDHYGKHGLTTFMACNAKNFRGEPGEAGELFSDIKYFEQAVDKKLAEDPSFQLITKG